MPDEPQNQSQDQFPDPPVQPTEDDTRVDAESDNPTERTTFSSPAPEVEAEPSTQSTAASSDSMTIGPTISEEPDNQTGPAVAAPVATTPTVGGKASGGSKKKWFIGGILAAVLVVLLGGGALAYNLWYQNPDKVILDGINNLFDPTANASGKATVSVENKDVRLDVTANVKSDKKLANGDVQIAVRMKSSDSPVEKVDVKADFAVNDKTAYFKLNNLRPLAEDLVDAYVDNLATQYKELGFALTQKQIDQQKQQMLQQLNPIITKIDNRWIKVDTESSDEDDDSSKCTSEVLQKFYDDKKMRNEVLEVYKDHKFITVKEKLGSKDGSLGYLLDFNETQAKEFGTAVKQTTFGKELEKCDKSSGSTPRSEDSSAKDKDSLKDTRIELWVDRWSHRITEVKIAATTTDSSQTAISFGVTYNYDKVDGLTVPKDAVDIKDLEKEFSGDEAGARSTNLIPLSI